MSAPVGQHGAMVRLALDTILADVVRALAADGVHPLVLKGPAFARWLYDDPGDRPYNDIDLLVAPADFGAAERCLAQLGFHRWQPAPYARETPGHHEVWLDARNPLLRVELHRRLALTTAPEALVWRRMTEAARPFTVRGVEVRAPGEAAGALLAGLHAAQHGAPAARPIDDLRRAVERVDGDAWSRAAELARELGCAGALGSGLSLVDGGDALAARLGLNAGSAPRGVRLRAVGPAGAATTFAWLLDRLRAERGVRPRARLVAGMIVPPREWVRQGYPVARRGRPGLLLAYGLRLVHVAAMLPAGLRDWRRAAR